MKPGEAPCHHELLHNFSTLDSGLRDETKRKSGRQGWNKTISVPSTRVYAMKLRGQAEERPLLEISVPSTRVYAMKPFFTKERRPLLTNFSTLDSGLRDETGNVSGLLETLSKFQYPRLGSTR